MGYYLKKYNYSVRLIVLTICFGFILMSLSTTLIFTFSDAQTNTNIENPIRTTGNQYFIGSLQSRVIPKLINTSINLSSNTSPYYIESHITITNNGSLNIEPEVEIYVNGSYYIYVEGTLNATGTANQHITFTSNNSLKNPGDWGGIQFNTTGNGNLEYCFINYSNTAITVKSNNNLTFINNSISFAKDIGIEIASSNVKLTNNSINNTILAINLTGAQNISIVNNRLY